MLDCVANKSRLMSKTQKIKKQNANILHLLLREYN